MSEDFTEDEFDAMIADMVEQGIMVATDQRDDDGEILYQIDWPRLELYSPMLYDLMWQDARNEVDETLALMWSLGLVELEPDEDGETLVSLTEDGEKLALEVIMRGADEAIERLLDDGGPV